MHVAAWTTDRPSRAAADLAMARYGAGEETAFYEVYDAVCPELERYLARRCRDRSLIDDLLQQTFLKMHCHRGSFRAGEPVLPWAYAIALRLLIDHQRHQRREARTISETPLDEERAEGCAPTPDRIVAATQALRQLEAELAQLGEPQRRAFEVVRLEGRSHAEAATLLDTTVTGVKLRLFRAVARLRALLGEESGHE